VSHGIINIYYFYSNNKVSPICAEASNAEDKVISTILLTFEPLTTTASLLVASSAITSLPSKPASSTTGT
jgi:hypothetical protein